MLHSNSLLLLVVVASSASAYSNIYGEPLQSCSSDGMALTGYTRTGRCVSDENDNGSHHVCIDLSSTSGGNFCSVTGQSNWCSSSTGCHGDQSAQTCQIKNWCVCEWAFASYIELAGGCDAIQDLKCDAINIEVIAAYQGASSQQKYKDALACIAKRCSLSGVTEF